MKVPLKFLNSSLKEVDPRDSPSGSSNVQADPGSLWTHTLINTNSFDSPFPGAFPYYSVSQSLYVASRFVPPGNTLKLLSGQRHAYNASQVKGFRTRLAFRCSTTPGVLRATSMLFILKKNPSNAIGVK